ncbi:MAG: hypothetical protein HYV97_18415 [Bdellovibrio sp.]|nr:hypothetical protein [Bdellovibrio sp.]
MNEIIIKSGRFKYTEKVSLKFKIVQRDFTPGSGDYADASIIQDDQPGTCYEILYEIAGEHERFAGGGYFRTVNEAINRISNMVQVVNWDG